MKGLLKKISKEKVKKILKKASDFLWFLTEGAFFNVFLPCLPVAVVWGGGCMLFKSVEWNEIDFFTDLILVATGFALAGWLFFYRISKDWKSKWKVVPTVLSVLEYAFCVLLFLMICARDGISNPDLRKMLTKNTVLIHELMWVNVIVFGLIILFVIIFYCIDCFKKEKSDGTH